MALVFNPFTAGRIFRTRKLSDGPAAKVWWLILSPLDAFLGQKNASDSPAAKEQRGRHFPGRG